MIHELWPAVFQQLGASGIPPIESLMEAYADPARAYHNWEHIEACLKGLQNFGELTTQNAVALFYHDCVYDTRRSDNEEQSADYMARELQAVGVPEPHIGTIRRLILATRHRESPRLRDEQVVVDVDLSILGSGPLDYRRYVDAIRQEYGWVDDASFATGRGAFLEKLLARDHIFSTGQFRLAFEDKAQANIRRELEQFSTQ
ncbi:hypothetical protein BH11VER1_BH11VER1_12710 [soil metagenome]